MLLTVRGVDGRTTDRQQRTASDHNSPSPVFGSVELRIEQMLTRNVNQNQNSCSVVDLHETLQKKISDKYLLPITSVWGTDPNLRHN